MPKHSKPSDLANYVFNNLKPSKKPYQLPDLLILEELFECMYFSSMQSEEGQQIQVTITFFDPLEADIVPSDPLVAFDRWGYTAFGLPIPLTIKSLVKLSKAADPWSSSLAVYYDGDDKLLIYGMIDQAIHNQSFVNHEIEAIPDQPGLFQAAIQGVGIISVTSEYKMIAILRQNVLVKQFIDVWNYGPVSDLLKSKAQSFSTTVNTFLNKNFPKDNVGEWEKLVLDAWRDTLSRIIIQIKNYHHGGALLITDVVKGLDIKYPLTYKRLRGGMGRFVQYSIAAKVTNKKLRKEKLTVDKELFDKMEEYRVKKQAAINELKGAIRFIASHSCVDGLIVLNNEMQSLGFGAVIDGIHPPKEVFVSTTASVTDNGLQSKSPKEYGTRHQSMMSFCSQNVGAIGIVISQDGDIRVMTKLGDRLIVWENVRIQKYQKTNQNIYFAFSIVDEL